MTDPYIEYRFSDGIWKTFTLPPNKEYSYEIVLIFLASKTVRYHFKFTRCRAFGSTSIIESASGSYKIVYGEVGDIVVGAFPSDHSQAGRIGIYFPCQDKYGNPRIEVLASANGFVSSCPRVSSPGDVWLAGQASAEITSIEPGSLPKYSIDITGYSLETGEPDYFYSLFSGLGVPEIRFYGQLREKSQCPPDTSTGGALSFQKEWGELSKHIITSLSLNNSPHSFWKDNAPPVEVS